MKKPRFYEVEVEARRSLAPTWLLALLMSGAGCNPSLQLIDGADGSEPVGGSSVTTAGGSEAGTGGSCASGVPQGGSSEYYGGWSAAGGGSEYYGGYSQGGSQ